MPKPEVTRAAAGTSALEEIAPGEKEQRPRGYGDRRRILLLISDLEYGGAQRQVIELANNLDPRRFDVHVATLADYVPLSSALADGGPQLRIIRKRHKLDFTVVPALVRLMRTLRTQVLHTFLFDAEFFGRIAGRLAGVPAIIGSERNTDYVPLRRHLWAFAMTRSCSDAIIANSRAGADFNSRTFHVPRAKYRVVHNGVDAARFRPRESRAPRNELKIGDDQPVVGMFASFKEQKNHPLLLRAARQVIRRFPGLRLLLVGDELYKGMSGSVGYHKSVQTLVDQLDLREHCVFAGNRQNVEIYYPVCQLTVLPSLSEGTPNVALESMASGVPVVATDVSDNAKIIPDGKVGFIVPQNDEGALADRICRLLGSEKLRETMGREARQWVMQEFSGDRLAEKTAAVYDEVLIRKGLSKGSTVAVPATTAPYES